METVVEAALVKAAIGKSIRERRLSLNLSLEEIAEKMNTSPGYVGLVEAGRRSFSVVQMITLTNILGVTLDELVPTNDLENWPQIATIITYLHQMEGTDIERVIRLCENALKQTS